MSCPAWDPRRRRRRYAWLADHPDRRRAALLAAVVAMLLNRVRAARRHITAPGAAGVPANARRPWLQARPDPPHRVNFFGAATRR
jgi:hypothetical protein